MSARRPPALDGRIPFSDVDENGAPARHTRVDALMDTAAEPDLDLLLAHRSGDPDAFLALYRRHSRPLYAFARTMAPAHADDLLQETFLRLMDADPRELANVKAWLFTVLCNLGRDLARRDRVRRANPPAREGAADPVEQSAVAEALRRLPEEQRDIVALKVFGGLTIAEAAEVAGIPAATATSRYRYALEKLAALLGDRS
jgi:RNA polymerase sigma-70 factor (ECF subfamily)